MITTIRNKQINYRIVGEGQPFLLVHGWGGSIKSLEALAQLIAKTHQAIILDLPGFGESDLPDENWGVEEYAQFLEEFVKSLGLKKIVYFGHSFGGSLGIYLSSQKDSLIEKLILCGSSYKRENKTSKLAKFLRFLPFDIKKIIYRIFFPRSDLLKYPKLEKNFRKIIRQDLTSCLADIKIPTLILWGEKDQETPLALANELKNKISNSFLKLYPQSSHNLPLKNPELIIAEINKFI